MRALGNYIDCDGALCQQCQLSSEVVVDSMPIFSNTESDTPTHCCECHELIPHALTTDGYQYVADAIKEHFANGRGQRSVLLQWWMEYTDSLMDYLPDIVGQALGSAQ